MATANFIPEIWSKKLLKIFDKTVVMANLVNRDFEGEITNAGDVVHVRTFGDVTVNNYTRDMTISFQSLTDPMVDLLIDQQKYFAFKVDDLDKAQANVDILEGYAGRAAIAIRDVVDTRLIGHYTDVDSGNVIGTDVAPITLTSANIYGYITQLAEKLDNANAPQEGRNLVITPKFKTLLLQSTEFTRATSLGDNVVQNGYIGNVAGFGVHVTTNNPAVSGVVNLLAFTQDFISFASQVSKIETVRPYNMFADAVKGLYLYGSKVMMPKAGAVLKASA
ncbi:P22 phage major capsid protein family protein [Vampirovibrio chlorellavorus]|uniref:P22 phage major capsid protein family protein n=1 Tax=Vampirovibrio chlorellavorus TaxID=758823 RepID=UPI0026E972C6|nr:P22 phage major capsid protein family protein [Vampirovibrio chlorellavorus]